MTPRERYLAAAAEQFDALLAAVPQPVPVTPPPVVIPPPVVVPPPPPPPDPTPVPVATGHPRIMLSSQSVRLKAGLAQPAGSRWRSTVDRWLGGGDVYNFAAWNGALLYALTGDKRYAVKAIVQIDTQVIAAEQQIAAGGRPEVAGDSYLQVGEMIGDLALVYDWCYDVLTATQRTRWIAYANQMVTNVWGYQSASWGGKAYPWTGWGVDD